MAKAQAAEAAGARSEAERLLGEARQRAEDAEERTREAGTDAAHGPSAASRAEAEARRDREALHEAHAAEVEAMMRTAQPEPAQLQRQCEQMLRKASEAEGEREALRRAARQAALTSEAGCVATVALIEGAQAAAAQSQAALDVSVSEAERLRRALAEEEPRRGVAEARGEQAEAVCLGQTARPAGGGGLKVPATHLGTPGRFGLCAWSVRG